MHPALKGRPRQAFEAFVHEILHIVNFEEPKRTGHSRFRLRHDLIHHLDDRLAFALMSMGVSFRCVCRRCEPVACSRFRPAEELSTRAASAGNGSCRNGHRGRGMSPRPEQEDVMAQGGRGRTSSGGASKSSRGSNSSSSSSSGSRGRGQTNRGRSSSGSRKRSSSRSGSSSNSSSR